MFETLTQDLEAVRDRDPAAGNTLEILLAYPGLHALWLHRLAHWLWGERVPVIPRLISNFSRWITGIEIHPGARIGRGVFIDHGMGVVIGETSEVGDYVTLYQGVTLGGTGKERGKRHPTVGRNVVIAAGAKVLGPITIGDDSKVGAGAVVVQDVPPCCTVVGIPGKVVMQEGEPVVDLHHEVIPDPVMECIEDLGGQVKELQDDIHAMQQSEPVVGPHPEAIPGPVLERIENLGGLLKKLEGDIHAMQEGEQALELHTETVLDPAMERIEDLGGLIKKLEDDIHAMQEGEAAADLHPEAIPDSVTERLEGLDGLVRKLESNILKTQFEMEITQEKLYRAEEELRRVGERIGEPPDRFTGATS